jgi:enoyl-CoA hydratase/carnithine racemase
MLTGRKITAAELLDLRLVNRVVSADQLEEATRELSRAITTLPRDGIVSGRVAAHLAYEALGIAQAFTPHYALLPHIASMTREPDEFDFHARTEAVGMKAAMAERDQRYGGDYWRW